MDLIKLFNNLNIKNDIIDQWYNNTFYETYTTIIKYMDESKILFTYNNIDITHNYYYLKYKIDGYEDNYENIHINEIINNLLEITLLVIHLIIRIENNNIDKKNWSNFKKEYISNELYFLITLLKDMNINYFSDYIRNNYNITSYINQLYQSLNQLNIKYPIGMELAIYDTLYWLEKLS